MTGSTRAVQRLRNISRRWPAALIAIALAAACGDNLGSGGPPCSDCGGPDAGSPDAGGPGIVCDDNNACTADIVEGSGCSFEPVSDGTSCDDGDLCTLGDQCRAGECDAGERADGELAILGSLDNLGGRRVVLGPDRFAVITIEDLFRGRIQVVSAGEDGLTTLSVWRGGLTLITLGDDDILAHAFEGSGLVAVTARNERRVRLFSASDAEVVPRGELELSTQINTMSGRGDRLWLCTGNPFFGYWVTLVDLSDADAPVEVGGMPLGEIGCGSVAVNADGSRVYVNTTEGVRYVDATPLDTGGDPTLSDIFAPTAGVSISGSRLLLRSPGAVDILDEPSLDQLATVPAAGARAAALFGDRLLVEGNRAVGGESEHYVAWYDALGGAPRLLDEVVTATFIGAGTLPPFVSATDGVTLLTGTRRFDLGDDRLDEHRAPELGPLASLARTGAGLRAYHQVGAAAIDTSDPASPAFAAGGAFAAARRILTIAIDDTLPAPAFVTALGPGHYDDFTRVGLDSSNPYFDSPLRIDRWTLDAAADLVDQDHFTLEHTGTSQLLIAGDFLFRYRRPDTTDPNGTFQAIWLPAARNGATAAPTFDLSIPASTTARRGFDVDPRARVAVVSTEVAMPSGDPSPVLLFYDLSVSPPALLETLAVDTLYPQLRIAGDRVTAVHGTAIVFFERGQGELSRVTGEFFEIQLLAFDGATAYAGYLEIVPGKPTYSLAAIPFADPAIPTAFEVNAIPRSLVAQPGGLAVGFDTQLLMLHPHCPSAAIRGAGRR